MPSRRVCLDHRNRQCRQALAAIGVKREEVILASKVLPQNLEPAKLREACERSIQVQAGRPLLPFRTHVTAAHPRWDRTWAPRTLTCTRSTGPSTAIKGG